MPQLSNEMLQWLSDNREDYEFYLLHAIFHDYVWRSTALTVPVANEDFRRESYALVIDAITKATKVMNVLGRKVETPPTPEFLRTYIQSAAKEEGSDEETLKEAFELVRELQKPEYSKEHYCVRPYFEAWYGSERSKKVARKTLMMNVPDVHASVSAVQSALSAAAQATISEEEDMMNQFMTGTNLDREERRSTGIAGLDACLNGGWGKHECYLLFGGTGAGKSIAAGQCAWQEAKTGGWPLIVSTELWPREYVCRIISNAAGIPINIIQDCENVQQLQQAVAMAPGMNYKIQLVAEKIDTIQKHLRVAKISAEEGINARSVLEREALYYEKNYGCLPTFMTLDWLGSVADVSGNAQSSSDRSAQWEASATSCVKFSEETGIPLLVLAQAVNDSQHKSVLTLQDIGISKGIAKNMIAAIGVTNTMDRKAIMDAAMGKADMPKSMILDDQFFCLAKARKGEGNNVPVTRKFRFQRFESRNPTQN